MSSQFKFLHAANLRLDTPLQGLGELSQDIREIVQEASYSALDQLITHALDHEVDFVLLTGNLWDAHDVGLRARIEFSKALEYLNEAQIPVYILPGELDPTSAWRQWGELPENVTVLESAYSQPIDLLPNAPQPVSMVPLNQASHTTLNESAWKGRSGWNLGVAYLPHAASGKAIVPEDWQKLPFQYLALGGLTPSHTIQTRNGVIHHPGSTQGISPQETGCQGATLVEVDHQGRVRCQFLSTATVRREEVALQVSERISQTELVEKAWELCDPRETHPGEKVWVIQWNIQGWGELFAALHHPSTQKRLAEQLEILFQRPGIRLHHTFERFPDWDQLLPTQEQSGPAHDYFTALQEMLPLTRESLLVCLRSESLPDDLPAGALEGLIQQIDPETVLGQAVSLGNHWFSPTSHS